MPSSDRKQKRDRPEQKPTPRERGRRTHADQPVQPPQYFDPDEPWDTQSAEALARLYETGEAYLHRRPGDKNRKAPPEQPPQTSQRGSPDGIADRDRAWLDARLTDISDRLQVSLAKINPDKAVEPLTHRLDAIEERFREVLERVAQRSDLDGLKLIEAHVLELSAHVEQTRSRLDRLDTIDERVQGIARKLDEADHERLKALEKMLQDYVAEWRKNDTRTATALQQLEGAVTRVGDSIEALEAHRPVPDLSLSMLNPSSPSRRATGTDPISQVYAEAARSLEPDATREILDAANYVPSADPAHEEPAGSPSESASMPEQEHERQREAASGGSASLRGIREKLRQAGLLGPDDVDESPADEEPAKDTPHQPEKQSRIRRLRPNVLLSVCIPLFGVIGFFLVDTLMGSSAALRHAPAIDQSANQHRTRDSGGRALPPLKAARIEAIGTAMAAAFRDTDSGTPSEPALSMHQVAPVTPLSADDSQIGALPMAIGPVALRQAALSGDTAAQIEVAARFAAGQGVERDLTQAVKWYGRAAAQGSAVGQYRLAAFYERGWGASRDVERARAWYARAAKQGNVKAMHNLGALAVSGGQPDYSGAATWFIKAAEFGLADSQVNLAILHQNGLGVPKDLEQAYKWLALAARSGDREAAARINQVKAQLSSRELATAQAAVAAWRARAPDPAANDPAAPIGLNSDG